jgi:hypothetical protein
VPESQFVIELFNKGHWDKDRIIVPQVLDDFKHHWRFELWNLDIETPPDFEETIGTSYPGLIRWIVEMYGRQHNKPNPRIWIDHTPSNLKYACRLLELFPDAKMIHVVRDGRAVASSLMKVDWGPNEIHCAAHRWVEELGYGLAAESFWGRKRVARFRYEDLVRDPVDTGKRLCAFLAIRFDTQMGLANGFVVPEYSSKQHAFVGKRPDVQRAAAWETELDSRQIELFEAITGDLLNHMGYTLKFGRRAKPMTSTEKRTLDLKNWTKQLVKRFEQRRRMRRYLKRTESQDSA